MCSLHFDDLTSSSCTILRDILTSNNSPMAALPDTTPPKNPRTDGYGYNPRCIKRDISGYLVERDATPAKIAALITGSKTIGPFQDTMQANGNVHMAGHFTVSGDPGSGTCASLTLGALLPSSSTNAMLGRLLHVARRPIFLSAPCHDRSHVVDLAGAGLRK
jgi:hypothetical protein